jgi:hypothetical protein
MLVSWRDEERSEYVPSVGLNAFACRRVTSGNAQTVAADSGESGPGFGTAVAVLAVALFLAYRRE